MQSDTLAQLAITRGSVLCGHFDGISHPKLFVVMGEHDNHLVGFFFINSNIHKAIQRKPAQFEMQMQIKRSDYDFLKYDSFICASEIKTISKDKIVSDIYRLATNAKGNLTELDMGMLLNAVRESDLFSKFEKDTFFK